METKYKTASDIKEPVMIGRDNALKELQGWFVEIEKGIPKFALIQGEQGIGKTKLVKELRQKAKELNSKVEFFEQVCRPEDDKLPFCRVIRLFMDMKQRLGTLSRPEYKGNPPGMLAPDFIEFAIASLDEENMVNIYSQVESDPAKIFASAKAYFLSHAYKKPICIVWEDLHHADRETAEFLHYLGDAYGLDDPIMNIGLYRGEERSGENNFQRVLARFRAKEGVGEIKLYPIMGRETVPFLRALLGNVRIDQSEAMPLYKVTHGNPYQLIEFVHSMAEQGKIQWQDGAWQMEISRDILTRPPKGVEEQLILNMGKLGANHLKIMEALAIASCSLTGDMLTTLTGLKPMQISLVVNDLIKEKYLIQEEETQKYGISSSNIEAESLKRLDEKQQKKMHHHFAKAWEKNNSSENSLMVLADHFLLAHDIKKSMLYSLEAGRWLIKERRLRLALKYYRQALKLCKEGKKKGLFEIMVEMGFLLASMGNQTEALKCFEEAKTLAVKPHERVQVLKGKGLCMYGMRKYSQALKEFKDAMRIPQQEKDAEMLLYQASLDIYRFQLKKAKTYVAEAKKLVGGKPELTGLLKKQEGLLYFYLGAWKHAAVALKTAEEHYTEMQSNQDIVETLLGKAYLIANTQSLDKANEIMHQVFTMIQGTDDWVLGFLANYQAGLFAWEQKEIEKAKEFFQNVETISKKGSDREAGYSVLGMGLCALHGKIDPGYVESMAQKTLEIANNYKDKFLAAEAYCMMGKMYMFTKQFQDAVRYLDYSRDAYRVCEFNWKINRLAAFYARVHTLTKQPKKALELLVGSEKQARERGDLYHLADNFFERGFLLGFNRKFAEAAQWFHRAGEFYIKLGKRNAAQDAAINEQKCSQAVRS